ncbi:hypothetical protein SAMN02745866_04029 [Alteromonadaceae bacterium Bs31]|nr:hypothetical protein SAMN02745866_04029 [Alteromonadaceae bacterium Bs31]
MKVFQVLTTSLFCISLLSLSACKRGYNVDRPETDPTPTPPPEEQDKEFHGAGSSWNLSLDEDNNTFELVRSSNPEADPNLELSGDTTELSSGFIAFEVRSSSDLQVVELGDTFHGIRLGEELTVLSPNGAAPDQLLFLSRANNCPSSKVSTNWVLLKFADTLNTDEHVDGHYGLFEYSPLGETAIIENFYKLSEPEQAIDGIKVTDGTCDSSGILSAANRQIYFSQGSTAVIELAQTEDDITNGNSANTQFLVSLQQRSISAASDYDGKHIGLLRDSAKQGGEKVDLVKADCTSGECSISFVTDPENGSVETDTYTLRLPDEEKNIPNAGFVLGSLSNSQNAAGTSVCTINTDYAGASKHFFACVGYSPGDDGQFTHMFLVSE